MGWEEVYRRVCGLSSPQRKELAESSIQTLREESKRLGIPYDTEESAIRALISLGVSADKVASREEHDLYSALFGEEGYETFFRMTDKGTSEERLALVDSYVDQLGEEAKKAACILALCFMSANGHMGKRERDTFERLVK